MDFEEFKFEPMTQGLGFDKQTAGATDNKKRKKTKNLDTLNQEFELRSLDGEAKEEYSPVSRSLKKMLDSLPPSMDFVDDSDRVQGLKPPLDPVTSQLPMDGNLTPEQGVLNSSGLERNRLGSTPSEPAVFGPVVSGPTYGPAGGSHSHTQLGPSLGADSHKISKVDSGVVGKTPVPRAFSEALPEVSPEFAPEALSKVSAPVSRSPFPKEAFSAPRTNDPLPKAQTLTEPTRGTARGKGFDISLNNSIESAFPKVEFQKSFYHQQVKPKLKFKEISSSFTSAIIDGGVCLGLTLALVTLVVALTAVDVNAMLVSRAQVLETLRDMGLLFIGSTLVYFTVARSLFGSTLGDWAFDVQLGTVAQRRKLMYPFQVFFRAVVIMATGVLLIPLISLGFGKDMAHKFSGLRLYVRQY